MRNIAVVTGSRADYGLLVPVIRKIQKHPNFNLQLLVTGMHLCPEFGETVGAIEEDGFPISAKIETQLSSDTATGMTKTLGLGIMSFADEFARNRPDLVLLLGDRYEIFAVAQAATMTNIPIAHLCGGDTTEGAIDEVLRHCITKMSHIHFPTNECAAKRIVLMGENPDHVILSGSPGLDLLSSMDFLSKEHLGKELGINWQEKSILCTFHPVTRESDSSTTQMKQLLDALSTIAPSTTIIFSCPNADAGGRIIRPLLERFAQEHANASFFSSLGSKRYLSIMSYVDIVLGNSSSGLYETPSFKIPTVNIGDRQKGRTKANSVIDCQPITKDILNAINSAYSLDCSSVTNPYGDGTASEKIVSSLDTFGDFTKLLKKSFYTSSD